jgi:hypothetical protein
MKWIRGQSQRYELSIPVLARIRRFLNTGSLMVTDVSSIKEYVTYVRISQEEYLVPGAKPPLGRA